MQKNNLCECCEVEANMTHLQQNPSLPPTDGEWVGSTKGEILEVGVVPWGILQSCQGVGVSPQDHEKNLSLGVTFAFFKIFSLAVIVKMYLRTVRLDPV